MRLAPCVASLKLKVVAVVSGSAEMDVTSRTGASIARISHDKNLDHQMIGGSIGIAGVPIRVNPRQLEVLRSLSICQLES